MWEYLQMYGVILVSILLFLGGIFSVVGFIFGSIVFVIGRCFGLSDASEVRGNKIALRAALVSIMATPLFAVLFIEWLRFVE